YCKHTGDECEHARDQHEETEQAGFEEHFEHIQHERDGNKNDGDVAECDHRVQLSLLCFGILDELAVTEHIIQTTHNIITESLVDFVFCLILFNHSIAVLAERDIH